MGIEAITQSDDGRTVIPSSKEDWRDWVSATSVRNFLLHDPLLDWLNLYGEANGFQKDSDLAGYDIRTDFTQFIFRKGSEFEAAVLAHLRTLTSVVTVRRLFLLEPLERAIPEEHLPGNRSPPSRTSFSMILTSLSVGVSGLIILLLRCRPESPTRVFG